MAALERCLQAQPVRFLAVGGGAAVLLMGLTWGLLRAGAPPFVGGFCAYALTFAVAFLLQHHWTFRDAGPRSRTLPRYFLVQVGCGLLSAALAHLLVRGLGWPSGLASAAMTVCASAVSYLASSLWAFRT